MLKLLPYSSHFFEVGSRGDERRVIAHWHFFPISIDNQSPETDYYSRDYLSPDGEKRKFKASGGFIFERPQGRPTLLTSDWHLEDARSDIAIARSIGVDGFQFNINGLREGDFALATFETYLKACEEIPGLFYLMACLDCTAEGISDSIQRFSELLKRIDGSPSIFRNKTRGAPLFALYLPNRLTRSAWESLSRYARGSGHLMMAMFLSPDDVKARPDILEACDYLMLWSGDYVSSLGSLDLFAYDARRHGKRWVAPIWPQDARRSSFSFVESWNSETFRKGWDHAISLKCDIANLITWNDYSEGSEIRPSSSIKTGFLELTEYYIAIFKKDHARISRFGERLIYFHRKMIVGATGITEQAALDSNPYGPTVTNYVEVVAILRSPAFVEIRQSGGVSRFACPAGLSSCKALAEFGVPVFRLIRDNIVICEIRSSFEISAKLDYEDPLYCSGSSGKI